ncbi:MAG: ECF transporter S component [Suilimivivens sp.]
MPVRKITRIALLSAILYVSKVALEFLPNVELVSLLTVLYTLVFGKEAFLIVTVFNLFELIQWGFGTWWISYLYVWPLLVLITLLLKKFIKEEFLIWSVVSGLFGLIFGSLFAIVYLPVDPAYALAYWISGLPWDVWHGVCNFVLMLVIGKPLYLLLKKVRTFV